MLPLLSFYAGREAADSHPEQTALLLGVADEVADVLARTAPG
nr:hypothetical protein StreXyl84_00150 [Streptomyces sp. Xyl84]